MAVLLAAGCHDLRAPEGCLPAEGQELPILDKMQAAHCHETRAMQVVIRDAATLAQIPLGDVAVNFANQMLLIVTLGRVSSDRYVVDIVRVWRDGGRLRVEVAVRPPPPGSPSVMASPYCIAVVPRCDLNVAEFSPRPPTRVRSWQPSEPPNLAH